MNRTPAGKYLRRYFANPQYRAHKNEAKKQENPPRGGPSADERRSPVPRISQLRARAGKPRATVSQWALPKHNALDVMGVPCAQHSAYQYRMARWGRPWSYLDSLI